MREAKYNKPLTIALPAEIYNHIKNVTDRNKISMSEWIRKAAGLMIAEENQNSTVVDEN